ncbi:BTB/POZ domain-containing protein POB1-like [Lotus japonicus]|uniref:BTB/POZ domain-containing protein POB1-like n=1 Tax=Lotus japonicus TaxID=34305 RepID=UPI00258CBF6A|nr:BTB/POZ domain-containing protein POB1-like [Lotus japonicus]
MVFDVGFAFNDSNFSDRVLRIEITTDPPPNSDIAATANAYQVRHGKRKREDEETTVEGLPSVANNDDSTVKTLHINSLILAVKSTFFLKLFSNGMRESEQRHVTLKINASEEASLMELLNFMYRNSLNMLDVVVAADKFGVSSCMRYCTNLLLNSPMTPDSALLYLDLPHSVLMADTFQPLANAAKKYLAGRYKDITKFEEEVMAFPICGIEAILASNELEVESEDDVYDFVLKWARQHYNRPEERRVNL